MVADPAFDGAGQTAGLEIWRIENFEAVPYPEENKGKFYSGDSYIILKTKEVQGVLSWDIHFWLGKETSQDESGTAAIKSVELDDSLGGVPVQHREVQDYESHLFLSYFKNGVRYLPGGVATGFRHVDPDVVEKHLYQVKGKRNVRVKEVELNVSAMNKGDCFILDAGKDIYVYMGQGSKKIERLKAIQAANQIRDQDHAGRARVQIIDEYGGDVEKYFEELESGSPDEVPETDEGEDDLSFEKSDQAVVCMYKVSDDGDSVNSEKVGEKPLKQEMLSSGDCFILDTGGSGIFVWIGKECSKEEKVQAMSLAQKYLEQQNYPVWTRIQRVVDGGEPSTFKQYFTFWNESEAQIGLGRIYTPNQIAVSTLESEPEFDVSTLHREKRRLLAKNGGKAFGFMPDDGSGKVEVFRIENFELAPVAETTVGMFFGGDSYVLKYMYEKNDREHYIIYFWQGNASSQDEKAASAIHTVKMDEELCGRAVQVRVVQGCEPRHFLQIFKGKMVIFMGGHASGFRNIHDHDTYDADGTRLFHVKGTCDEDVRAVQVPEVAASLNSDDVFVLETPSSTYLWFGQGASDEEKQMATNTAELVSPGQEPQIVNEGEETDDFWSGVGGQGDYQKGFNLPSNPLLLPRLFHCLIRSSGKFQAEEIHNYTQEDLAEDDIMVLDSGDELYVWIGSGATPEEKEQGMKMAEEYIRTDPTDRNLDVTLIFTVKQGEEPDTFKTLFPSWDSEMWQNMKSYDDIKNEIAEANTAVEE